MTDKDPYTEHCTLTCNKLYWLPSLPVGMPPCRGTSPLVGWSERHIRNSFFLTETNDLPARSKQIGQQLYCNLFSTYFMFNREYYKQMVPLVPTVTNFYVECNEAIVHIKHCYSNCDTLVRIPG